MYIYIYMAWLIACSLGIILLSIWCSFAVGSGHCLFWHIHSGNVQSQDTLDLRTCDSCDGKRHPEITWDPFSILFLSRLWNVKDLQCHDLFPDEKNKQGGNFVEEWVEERSVKDWKKQMWQDQLIFPWLLDIVCQRSWGIVWLFELQKLFERKLLSILNLFEKKPWAKLPVSVRTPQGTHVLHCGFPANGSTVPFTQRVQDPVFAKFTRFHALNKNHVPGLGFFSGPRSRNAVLTSLMLWHWWHW